MTYATEARILHDAPRARVRELTALLSRYGCVSRVEWHRSTIVVELPEDDVAWILTGGFAELLQAFEDCLAWRAGFREEVRRPPAGLPPPQLTA